MTSGKRLADEVLRTSITLPADIANELVAVARARGLPTGAVAREFVIQGLNRHKMVERIADAVQVA